VLLATTKPILSVVSIANLAKVSDPVNGRRTYSRFLISIKAETIKHPLPFLLLVFMIYNKLLVFLDKRQALAFF